jgi:hypothetical protein
MAEEGVRSPGVSECPFYGVRLIRMVPGSPAILFPTDLNNCALMTETPGACIMSAVHWDDCSRNPAHPFVGDPESPVLALVRGIGAPPLARTANDAPDTIETVADFGAKFEALGHTEYTPDTPESIAEKCRQAREIGNRFADLRKADPTPVLSKVDGEALSEVKGAKP